MVQELELPCLLVRTQPRRERYAQLNLEQWFGKKSYLPFFSDGGKPKVLFPSYLFVFSEQWHFLKGAWGVSSVVMVGNEPAWVWPRAIDALRAREKNQLVQLPPPPAEIGDEMQVFGGPFKGFDGLYQGMDDHSRVKVLLDIFGRKVEIPFERSQVGVKKIREQVR